MSRIKMGNDEFILYLRKNNLAVGKNTANLGKSIWEWLQANTHEPSIEEYNVSCYWGDEGEFIDGLDLPKTATQFSFDRSKLPALYDYLDTL